MESLRTIDLNLLIVFEAVYSARNISHAASQMGMSQPTISNSLARLRDTLGDPLFVRSGRGVEPTAKAEQMIGPVREALRMITSGVTGDGEFDPTKTKRTFRMVLLDQLEPTLMPPVIRQIQDHHSVSLEILPVATTPVIEKLNDGTLDLVLSVYVNNLEEYDCEVIGRANVVVIARKNHPRINGSLTLDDFQSLGHISLIPQMRAMSRVDEMLQHLKIERHIAYTVTKFWSFPYIIAQTDLIALFPGDFAKVMARHLPLDLHPVPFELPEQQVYMTWKKNRSSDPGHRWLRDQIRQAYQQSLVDLGATDA